MKPKGLRELRGTISVEEVKQLKRALRSAKLKNCGIEKEHQDAFSLYLDTWVAAPLTQVLHALQKRHDAKTKGTL